MLYTSANFTIRTELSALWDTDSPCLLVLCWSCVLCGLCQSPDTGAVLFRVSYFNSRTPTPQAAFPPLRRGWTGSPHRGTSPPLDRTSGLPSKAAVYDLALPRHHRTRHPQHAGRARQLMFGRRVCCMCRPPLCGGRGAPPSRGGAHNFSLVCVVGWRAERVDFLRRPPICGGP